MLHYSQGVYGQDEAVAAATYGDDFDDDPVSGRVTVQSRPASGTEPGVTYGWNYGVSIVSGSNPNAIWLPSDRSGIQREPEDGAQPSILYLCPFNLGADGHWMEIVRTGSTTNKIFGGALCAPNPATGEVMGAVTVNVQATDTTGDIIVGQYTNPTGTSQLVGTTGASPAGSTIRAIYAVADPTRIYIYPVWPDTGVVRVMDLKVAIGGTFAGLTTRAIIGDTTPTVYSQFRCGSGSDLP